MTFGTVNEVGMRLRAFDGINFESTEGRDLKRYLVERLSELRERNDNEQLSERETALLRGRIAEVQAMLAEPMRPVALPRYDNPGRG